MIHIDKIIRKGYSHEKCEDYAIANQSLTKTNFIISDGCSSSIDTDVGSMILSFSADVISNSFNHSNNEKSDYKFFGRFVFNYAKTICKLLNVNKRCLDATLIYMWFSEDDNCEKFCNIYMYGDGSVIVIPKNEEPYIIKHEFSYNAPYYLSSRFLYPEQFKEEFSNSILTKIITNFHICNFPFDTPIIYKFKLSHLKALMISSDGIHSFIDKKTKMLMSDDEILKELTKFKNFNGEFIKRRITRMIADYEKNNISHYDDISISGFSITQDLK